MKAYKGFDKDLKCRDFQYEIGKTYETDKAELCKCGFHACLYPLDVFNYYNPAESRFCIVELDNVTEESSDDSKVCGTRIKIVKEVNLSELTVCAVDYVLDKVYKSKEQHNTGYYSSASNTGYYSSASNTGDYSSASVSGKDSVAIAIGYDSKAKASLGSAICVVERGEWNGNTYPLIAIKSAIIDGKTLKADTYYTVKHGEFVEVE